MRLFPIIPLALSLVIPAAAQAQTSVAGCWAGTIGTGARQRRLAVELTQTGSNWQGRYHRLEQAVESGDLSGIALKGDSISFTAAGAPFQGIVTGGEMKGTATGRTTETIALVRTTPATVPSPKLGGKYFGWLTQNSVPVMRIGLNLLPAPCQQLLVTMDSPDQGSNGLRISSLTTAGDSVWFTMVYINGAFVGALNGDSLVGQWTQSGGTLDMRLGRRDSTFTTRRPQEPVEPFPYASSEVSYSNPADNTRLAGTLTVPQGTGPFPAVLLITGSGAQDRNESLMGHKPFLVLADYLTRRGIAVLRVDDRGVGGSGGNTFAATISDNAGDALAGVEFLKRQAGVDSTRIGLVGHSEGGWVAPLAATRSKDVAFIVLIAGPAVTGEAIREVQDSLLTLSGGGSLNRVAVSRRFRDVMHRTLKAEPNDSVAVVRMVKAIDDTYAALPRALKAAADSSGGPRDSASIALQLRPLATPWYRYLLTFDPVPYLRRLEVPVLAVFGDKDLQVPAFQNAPVMRQALAGNQRARVQVFPGLNHLFQHARTGAIAEYGTIDETMAEDVLKLISDFITQLD